MNAPPAIHALQAEALKSSSTIGMMGGLQIPGFDIGALLQIQQKHINDITSINHAFFQNVQLFASGHAELMRQGMNNTANFVTSMMGAPMMSKINAEPGQA